ncbi:5485_t:CDS:2 [Acaulospora morrowiae]|uniref:5485_t:CDS:1 n=1 Tax=Acaulospora morrowiae TaxID=94023 RepID=A0A9N9AP84_9GLOM|nr:5485_t:CDS:2 [Acaulospora morrowiae]
MTNPHQRIPSASSEMPPPLSSTSHSNIHHRTLRFEQNSETKKPNEVKIKASNVTKSTKIHNLNNNHVSLQQQSSEPRNRRPRKNHYPMKSPSKSSPGITLSLTSLLNPE